MLRRSRTTILAAMLALAVSATTAYAVSSTTVTDGTGDVKIWSAHKKAPARYRAATDITQVTYSRDASRLYLKFRTRDVLPNERGLKQEVHLGAYMKHSKKNGTYYGFWDMFGNTSGATRTSGTRCAEKQTLASFSSAENWITLSIPIRCIPAGKVILKAYASINVERRRRPSDTYAYWDASDSVRTISFRIRD